MLSVERGCSTGERRTRDPHVGVGNGRQLQLLERHFRLKSVMLLDEPTAALGVRESRSVLDLGRPGAVNGQGVEVVMVSHVMPHVILCSR